MDEIYSGVTDGISAEMSRVTAVLPKTYQPSGRHRFLTARARLAKKSETGDQSDLAQK